MGGHVNLAHKHPGEIRPNECAISRLKRTGKWEEAHRTWMQKREAWRDGVELTRFQEQLILGGLLGDASILKGNSKSINARVIFRHSITQCDYCMWKYDELKSIVKTPPRIENNRGYGDKLVTFNTMSLPCLTEIHDLAKRDGQTTVTQEYLDRITDPIAVAVWAMDDGTRSKKIFKFSIGDRTQEEAVLLRDWLHTKWNIETKIYNAGRELILAINKQSEAVKLGELIQPWVIDSMKYKIMFTI